MSLSIRKSDAFVLDVEIQIRRYNRVAGGETSDQYWRSVDSTLQRLARHPGLGWQRKFSHPELAGLFSCLVARPFHRHVIFYRYDGELLDAIRVIHGSRDLPRRPLDSPGAPEENESE